MSKSINKKTENVLYNQIADLIELARKKVATSVNLTMVYTYFEIDKMIVNEEQEGKARAEYGKAILKTLSEQLSKRFGKGFSVENLDRMRFFYKAYSKTISSTPLTKLESALNVMRWYFSFQIYFSLLPTSGFNSFDI